MSVVKDLCFLFLIFCGLILSVKNSKNKGKVKLKEKWNQNIQMCHYFFLLDTKLLCQIAVEILKHFSILYLSCFESKRFTAGICQWTRLVATPNWGWIEREQEIWPHLSCWGRWSQGGELLDWFLESRWRSFGKVRHLSGKCRRVIVKNQLTVMRPEWLHSVYLVSNLSFPRLSFWALKIHGLF